MTEQLICSNRDIWWPLKNGTDTAVPLSERPCLWFSSSFIHHPKPGWSVDWDHIDHTTKKPTLEAETIFDPDYEPGDHGYMAGILIKCTHTAAAPIWRLTGRHRTLTGHDTESDDDIFEAKWPD